MADVEKILCPGCGAEMELAPLADFGLLYGFQYHCPRCGWDSPLMQTEREAREMAGKRAAETVVRCNNCIAFGKQPERLRGVIRPDTGMCLYTGKLVLPDDFCSNAVKIDGGAEE